MSHDLETPRLDLESHEIERRFLSLQQRLVPLWKAIESLDDDGEQSVVVVPSLTVEYAALEGSVLQAYEERFLFLLLLLRQPSARVIYVTSQAIQQEVVDYYLGLLPGVILSHARQRLFLVHVSDGAPQPLSLKLLQRPRLLARLRALIPNVRRAHLVPFNTTEYERELALRLDIPLYGADPRHLHYGTKSGSRRLFEEAGIPHPAGYSDLRSVDDLVDAVCSLRETRSDITVAMVKQNEGVSGAGNAVLDLRDLDGSSRDAIVDRLHGMELEAADLSHDAFLRRFEREGGIVEERIQGDTLTSPSAQVRITPTGRAELLSTHDQLLGGTSGQKYIGCTFPASREYASMIARDSMKVAQRLLDDQVLGRFAIDFVCARDGDAWRSYAIELNLRKGGTTHPFLTLQFLTDGAYDPESVEFRTRAGVRKCYVASDALHATHYCVFGPGDLFDVAVRHRLHFDPRTQTGVVFHMMSAVGDQGRLGLTAVGNSHSEARDLYQRTVHVLDAEARAALVHPELPEEN